MADFKDHVATLLENAGIPAASIKISTKATVPPGPGPWCVITPTGGAPPSRIHDSPRTRGYDNPSVQVRFHGADFLATYNMAVLAYGAVEVIRNQELEGVWYREIMVGPTPFDMGLDDTGRSRVAFNAMAVKAPS